MTTPLMRPQDHLRRRVDVDAVVATWLDENTNLRSVFSARHADVPRPVSTALIALLALPGYGSRDDAVTKLSSAPEEREDLNTQDEDRRSDLRRDTTVPLRAAAETAGVKPAAIRRAVREERLDGYRDEHGVYQIKLEALEHYRPRRSA